MRKLSAVLCAAMLFASAGLYSADRVGVGIAWGVGYAQFDDSRLSAVSQVIDLKFKLDTNLSVGILVEQASIAFDDGSLGVSADWTSTLGGLGIVFDVTKWSAIGLYAGKADGGVPGLEQTVPFYDFLVSVDLLEADGAKITYHVSVDLKYRFVPLEEIGLPTGDLTNMNCMEAILKVGVLF